MAHLLLDHPDYEPLRWKIDERLQLIGRGSEADIRIPDRSISRIHARLEPTPDGLRLEDLGSANGTRVNDVRIDGATYVSVGDAITIGSVGLRVVAGDPPRAPATFAADTESTSDSTRTEISFPDATSNTGMRPRGLLLGGGALLAVVALVLWATRPSTPPSAARAAAEMSTEVMTPTAPIGTEMTESARRALAEFESNSRESSSATRPTTAAIPDMPSMEEAPPATSPEMPAVSGGARTDEREDVAEPAAASSEAPPPPPATRPSPEEPRETSAATETAAPEGRPATLRYRGVEMPFATLVDRGLADESGRLVPTDEDRFLIRRVHLDLLCRTPSDDEYRRAAALSVEELVDRVMANPERWGAWYEDELYFMLLLDDFRPPEDRMRDLPGRLAAKSVTWKDALTEIVKSQYFNARNPGNDTYVTVVFEQMLGVTVQREPQLLEAGKKMYDGYASAVFGKRGKSQGDLVDIAVAHPAFTSTYLARLLKRLLGEAPPKTILDPLAKRLAADPSAHDAILRELLLSPAYGKTRTAARKKSDPQFIRGLWQDLFGRVPTYQELRNVRNATQALADPTGIRSVIVRTLLDGGRAGLPDKAEIRPETWIPEQFRRFLARQPSQSELSVFTAAFAKDSCKPGTILHALLTGTDYDRY